MSTATCRKRQNLIFSIATGRIWFVFCIKINICCYLWGPWESRVEGRESWYTTLFQNMSKAFLRVLWNNNIKNIFCNVNESGVFDKRPAGIFIERLSKRHISLKIVSLISYQWLTTSCAVENTWRISANLRVIYERLESDLVKKYFSAISFCA